MPIRQNILRKGKAPKQNLRSFDVFREETGVLGDLTISEFFKISEFPSVLPTGNSSFLIEGSNLLKPNVELKTEILDAQGNPIFHYAIPHYDKELPARRIAIEVYGDDVVNGVGSFTVLGELNPTITDVPIEFQDTYNVRFTAPITIKKGIKNTQPIRFYGQPTITVSELVKGVIDLEAETPTVTVTGSVSSNVNVSSTEPNSNSNAIVGGASAQDSFQTDTIAGAYVAQNSTEAQTTALPFTIPTQTSKTNVTFVVQEMEKGTDNPLDKVSSAFQGATITITNPHLLVDSTLYPDSKWTKPTTYSTNITKVLNSTTFEVAQQYSIRSKTGGGSIIVPLNASSSATSITYKNVSAGQVLNTVYKRSYANMTVGNLQTFSGDTYKAKIYMKEDGSAGSFEPIYETLVASPNSLVDSNSVTGFKNVGKFNSQSIVDNYWVTSSNLSSATQDDDTIVDGVILSGSNYSYGSSFTFINKDLITLEKNEVYVVEFNTAYRRSAKLNSKGEEIGRGDARLEVFLTGSAVSTTNEEFTLGIVDLKNQSKSISLLSTPFTKIKQKQISDFQTHNDTGSNPNCKLGFRVHSGQFIISDVKLKPWSDDNFSPGFFKANVPMPKPIKRGKNYDFLVEFYDANNNIANSVAIADNITFQGPPQVLADGLDATFSGSMTIGESMEMYGVNPAYLRTTGYKGFQHSIDNNLGGFMMFSGSINSRISASESGSSFVYDGVGLEVVDGGGDVDRYLRFRTKPSIFEVVTDTFFLGQNPASVPNGSFISGSNGILQISSSNFSVDASGNLTASGYISASGGHLGNFEIVDGKISGSNITMDANNSTIFKTDQGPGSDPQAAGFESQADEYYIDFTPVEENPDNYYIKMGPNFMVDKDGILIASGAEFIGTITASAGLIGGFTTDSHSFSSTNIFISGSPEVGGVDSPEYMFISTSNFNVKQNGDVTGSSFLLSGGTITSDVTILGSVSANSILTPATIAGAPSSVGNASASIDQYGNAVFRSGSIGGFRMDATTLFSDNAAFVVTGSTGQITGSQVLFTGGTIGGFELGESIISSSNGDLVLKSNGQITASNAELSGNLNAVHIKATSGSIGGWVLDTTELSGTNAVLKSSGVLSLGSGTDNYNQANRIYIDGANTRMSMGTGFKYASNALTIDGSATIGGWTINSSTITGGNVTLNSAGEIKVGTVTDATTTATTNSGFFADNSGNVLIKGNTSGNDYLKISGGGSIDIKAQSFDLDATTIILDSGTNNGTIRLGASGGPSSVTANTAGIYMDGSGDFQVYGDADNFLRFDISDKLQIAAETFDLDAGTIIINNSVNSGKIALGATPPSAYDNGTGFYVDGTGAVLIGAHNGNRIQFGGSTVTIQTDTFELDTTNLDISSTAKRITVNDGTQPRVYLGEVDDGSTYGMKIFDGNGTDDGDILVELGEGGNNIAGWTISSDRLTGGNLILRQDGVIETSNFVSGEKGFRLSAINNGTLEVEEATIRGTLKTTVFEKETVNAVGGQLVVANSTVITGSDVGKTDTTMSVVNVTGFEEDEILFIKKVSGSGFSKEFVQVGGSKRFFPSSDTDFSGELHVTRAYGTSATFNPDLHSGSLSDTAGTGSSYTPGQVVVSTGKLNTGYIKLNANPNDPQTPFIDIVERTGSGVYDVDLKARLGDLSGLSSALVGTNPGFGLFSENVFLTGKITATSGQIAGLNIASDKIYVGTGTYGNANTEFFVSSSGDFSLGSGLVWDASEGTLSIGSGIPTAADISASVSASVDPYRTQIVLSSTGMDLKDQSTNVLASYGQSAKIFPRGITDTYTEVLAKSIIMVSGSMTGSAITAHTSSMFGSEDKSERVEIVGTGLKVYESNKQMINVGSNGLDVYDTSNNLVSSFGSNVHLNTGTIYVGVTGSSGDWIEIDSTSIDINRNNSNKLKIKDTAVQIYGDSTTSFGLFNSSGLTFVDNNVTASTFTSTAATLYGASTNDRVVVDADGLEIYTANVKKAEAKDTGFTAYGDDVNTYAQVNSSGLTIYEDTTNVANFGSTVRVGVDSGTESALRIDGSGNLTIGTNSTSNISMTNTGVVTIAGGLNATHVKATSGSIGSWEINNTTLTGGNVTLDSSGVIKVGSLANASTTATTNSGFYVDNNGNLLIKADDNDDNYIKFDVDGGTSALQIKTAEFSVVGGNATFSGDLSAAGGTFSGNLSAAGGTFTGDLTAADMTLSGYLNANSMLFGTNVNGTNDGIYIDANDYWYSNGNFSLGNGGMTWDGATLSVTGTITANDGTIGGWTIDSDSIFTGTKDSSGFATNNADITINSTSGIHTKNFYVDTSGNAEFRGTVTIGSTDLTESNTLNTSDPLGAGVLNYNPNFTQVASDGRPDGIKSVYGSATTSNISYQDANKTILKLYNASDTSIGAGLPAIKVNKDAEYRIFFRAKSDAVATTGFYFRIQEYDSELGEGITHISNNAASSESGVVEDTRQINQGSQLVEASANDIDNGPISTSYTEYSVLYTPTSTAKYFSPIFLNWTGMGTSELHIEKVLIQIDTSDKTQGTVGGWTIDSSTITGGNVTLNSAGSIKVGSLANATTTATTNSGFFADNSGNVLIKGNTSGNKYIKISGGGGIDIKSDVFDLNATTLILDSATNSGVVQLGPSGGPGSATGTSNAGAYIDGTGKFNFVGDANNFIRFNSSGLEINTAKFDVNTSGEVTATDVTLTGEINATTGVIGGWNINGNTLKSNDNSIVLDEGNNLIDVVGTTTVGGSTVDTKIRLANNANTGSTVSLQREDFGGNLIDFVLLHTSQSYFNNDIGSYVSGSTRDDISFTLNANDSETITMAGTSTWGSGVVYLRSNGSNLSGVTVESGISSGQLLSTGEANLITEIGLRNLTEQANNDPGGTGKSLFRYKGEVFQNDANDPTGAELVGSFRISSLLSLASAATSLNIQQKFLLTKQYFYVKFSGIEFDVLTAGGTYANDEWTLAATASPIAAVKYLPKVVTSGIGQQFGAGPNQEAKFGARNEIVGSYKVKQTTADTEGNISIEGKASIGTPDIDDTFDLFVDGQIGATGNITAYYSSDERLKENIIEIKSGLSLINQLRPVKFDWKQDSPFGHLYPTEYGLIAQEVEQIIPEIVGKMKGGYKGINYESLVPLLVQSIQELTKRVEELEKDK